jgi:hypothetical protein
MLSIRGAHVLMAKSLLPVGWSGLNIGDIQQCRSKVCGDNLLL